MQISDKITRTREKQTRYQQIEDLCYVNQSTNEKAINNLNIYLGNLNKVLGELQLSEEKTKDQVQRSLAKYKMTIVKYKDRKNRGELTRVAIHRHFEEQPHFPEKAGAGVRKGRPTHFVSDGIEGATEKEFNQKRNRHQTGKTGARAAAKGTRFKLADFRTTKSVARVWRHFQRKRELGRSNGKCGLEQTDNGLGFDQKPEKGNYDESKQETRVWAQNRESSVQNRKVEIGKEARKRKNPTQKTQVQNDTFGATDPK